ncbi:MAG: ABC transporter substrate-binding protein [Ramlibacter sp.]
MKLLRLMLGCLAALAVTAGSAQTATQVTLQYPYASAFKPIFDTLVERFHAAHPGIRIVTRPPYQNYDDGLEQTLRGAIAGDLPDVSLQAINRQRVLVDRGIAQPLGRLVAAEPQWAARGYAAGLMSMGRFGGDVYGLPFVVSTPVVYFNPDLVRQAGGDPNNFPQDWNSILALAARINAPAREVSGISLAWDISGNWMWQALVMSHGGAMLSPDERKVAFGDAAGRSAIGLIARMVREGGMRNLKVQTAMQSFVAGKIGILVSTSAYTETITKGVGGRFDLRTSTFPLPAGAKARLPGGGSAVLVFAKTPQRQKAAWEFLKFITAAESAAYVARHTGYAPANQLAASDPRYLGDFYKSKPNHLANMRQLSVVTQWQAYPGHNGLKISDVIADHLQSVVAGAAEPEQALREMVTEVQALLPRS